MRQRRHRRRPKSLKRRIADTVLSALIAHVESRKLPWLRFAEVRRPRSLSGRAYHGINALILWCEESRLGTYQTVWGTYEQWAVHGSPPLPFEQATKAVVYRVAFPGRATIPNTSAAMFIRALEVFHHHQVIGSVLSTRYRAKPKQWLLKTVAEDRIARTLYAMIRRTGAPSLLHRRSYAQKDAQSQATERLVAALGCAFAAADLSLVLGDDFTPWRDLAGHLRALKHTPEAIFTVAAQAEHAARAVRRCLHATSPISRSRE